jgi:hypothetical protein
MHGTHVTYEWVMTQWSCHLWLIDMWHDSFVWVIHIKGMMHGTHVIDVRVITQSSCYTWMSRDTYKWVMTHLYVTWLISICDMTLSRVTWLIHMWRESFRRRRHAHMMQCRIHESWLIRIWHGSYIYVTWLFDVWHGSYICDMTHIDEGVIHTLKGWCNAE